MRKAKLFMDTVVDIQIVARGPKEEAEAAMGRAFEAFRKVEAACSRFSPDSELMAVCRQAGTPVTVSPFLFEPLKFALEMADWTDGRFDPAIGKTMEEYGFNVHYLTDEAVQSRVPGPATFRDILLNERDRTLTLRKPLIIDLGAVAKGFAIDLAAHELQSFDGFLVNAGGDLYAGGLDASGGKWKIGIRHPEHKDQVIDMLEVSNEAVCTSGSYERRSAVRAGVFHILDPETNLSPPDMISSTVIAPYAMMADAFSTASFVLGRENAEALLDEAGLRGMFIAADLQVHRVGRI